MRIAFAWRKLYRRRDAHIEWNSLNKICTHSLLSRALSHSLNSLLADSCPPLKYQQTFQMGYSVLSIAHITHTNTQQMQTCEFVRDLLNSVLRSSSSSSPPSAVRSVSLNALHAITVSTELNVSLATAYNDVAWFFPKFTIFNYVFRQRIRFTKINQYSPLVDLLNTFALVWHRFATPKMI